MAVVGSFGRIERRVVAKRVLCSFVFRFFVRLLVGINQSVSVPRCGLDKVVNDLVTVSFSWIFVSWSYTVLSKLVRPAASNSTLTRLFHVPKCYYIIHQARAYLKA